MPHRKCVSLIDIGKMEVYHPQFISFQNFVKHFRARNTDDVESTAEIALLFQGKITFIVGTILGGATVIKKWCTLDSVDVKNYMRNPLIRVLSNIANFFRHTTNILNNFSIK